MLYVFVLVRPSLDRGTAAAAAVVVVAVVVAAAVVAAASLYLDPGMRSRSRGR